MTDPLEQFRKMLPSSEATLPEAKPVGPEHFFRDISPPLNDPNDTNGEQLRHRMEMAFLEWEATRG